MSVHGRLGEDGTIIKGVIKVNIVRGAAKDERGRCRQSKSRRARDQDKQGAKGKWKKRGGSPQNVTCCGQIPIYHSCFLAATLPVHITPLGPLDPNRQATHVPASPPVAHTCQLRVKKYNI